MYLSVCINEGNIRLLMALASFLAVVYLMILVYFARSEHYYQFYFAFTEPFNLRTTEMPRASTQVKNSFS